MATFLEIQNSVNTTKAEIDKCLGRCLNAPYPNAGRKIKLDKLREEANVILGRVGAEISRIEAPVREQFAKLQSEIAQKQREQQDLQRKLNDSQSIYRAKQQEYQAKSQQANTAGHAAQKTELDKQWQATAQEFQSSSAELNRQVAEYQAKLNDLNAQQQKEQVRFNEEMAPIRIGQASDAMIEIEQEMQSLLDRAGALEKEIASGASVELVQNAKAEFQSKTADFSSAEVHHKSQARKLFWAMMGVIVLATVAVYVLFIYLAADPGNVERIVALATGRIAILVFLGLALKYLADLHRAHSEQAIIYCDRKAALTVAEVLLRATPELEQKRAVLKTLADIYLNFEDSAFVARRPKLRDAEEDVDVQIKRMKDVIEGMKPVLDAIGKVAEKIKP